MSSRTGSSVLQRAYEDFNDRYFGGKLPRYRVEVVDRVSSARESGEVNRRAKLIRIQRNLLNVMRETLIHEMAHVRTNDFHGPRWKAEVQRLLQLGAPISPDELSRAPAVTREMVAGVASNLLCDRPGASFRDFVCWIADQHLCMSPAQALRRFPWIRRVYREAQEDSGTA